MPIARPTFLTPLVILAAAVVATSSPALAQTPDLDAARLQALQLQAQEAQSRALEAEREANAAVMRLQTEQTLRGLADARAASPSPAVPQTPGAVSPIDSQLAGDGQRIMRLQQDALARSNARILAVRPAL